MLSYSNHFGSKTNVVLPGDTEHVRQIEGEVDDPTTGCCQVSPSKRSAEEETLHYGYHSIGSQEQEDHSRITVRQQVSLLLRTMED